MTTPVTEMTYPPLDSQATIDFITNMAGAVTGDNATDFRNALFIAVAPGGKANDYSIDDLWRRYIFTVIYADPNADVGSIVISDPPRGQALPIYYDIAILRNAGGAFGFPTGSDPATEQAMLMTVANGVSTPVISNGGLTLTCADSNFSWGFSEINDRAIADGGKWQVECTVDSLTAGLFFCMGMYDPDYVVSAAFAGNRDGCSSLLQTSSLTRTYTGAADSVFQTSTSKFITAGSVVTMAVDLDLDTVEFFVDGVTIGAETLLRDGNEGLLLRPVFKTFGTSVCSINPTILHPVDGYLAWG